MAKQKKVGEKVTKKTLTNDRLQMNMLQNYIMVSRMRFKKIFYFVV